MTARDKSNKPNEEFGRWIDALTAEARFGKGDRRGTANLIDEGARRRAAEAIREGLCVQLARPLRSHVESGAPGIQVDLAYGQMEAYGTRSPFAKPLEHGSDVTHVEPHGTNFTHMDALNHMGRGGKWYGGYAVDDPNAPSVADLADHGLFTRGVLVDIPAVRDTGWVLPGDLVSGDDIDAALTRQGAEFAPGDALLLYMGRDRFEASGGAIDLEAVATGSAAPGAGEGAARWIAEHDVSMLAWDFLDGFPSDDAEATFCVHLLIPAIGMVLIDNCYLGPAAGQVQRTGRSEGAFIVPTPPIPKATGALVQPLFIQ